MARRHHLGRRALLSSMGAAGLAPFVPILDSQAEGEGVPKRLIVFWTPNGLMRQQLRPGSPGDLDLGKSAILSPLADIADEVTFLEGVDFSAHIQLFDSTMGDHDPGHRFCLTGDLPGLGPSLDQFIAAELSADTPYPSLALGVRSSGYAAEILFRTNGESVALMNDPQAAFATLFGDFDLDTDTLVALQEQRRSVLDVASRRLQSLRSKVSAADRMKMDAHIEAIAAVEAQLEVPACSEPMLVPGSTYREEGDMQIELALAALRCDMTRVVSLQWSCGASDQAFPDLGIPYMHHSLAHLDVYGVADADVQHMLFQIGAWYAQRLRTLVDGLRAWPEGDGTMFDNTVILWCSEHAAETGAHHREDMPYLLVGRAGGHFAGNRYARYDHASNNDLFLSVIHAMGLDHVTTFGAPELCSGPLSGLT
jgi:hypothetical protein